MRFVALALLLGIGPYRVFSAAAEMDAAETISELLSQLREYDALDKDVQKQRLIGFDLPEELINSYVEHVLNSGGRPGLRSATLSFLASGVVHVRAVIDTAALLKWQGGDLAKQIGDRSELELSWSVRIDCHDSKVQVAVVTAENNGGPLSSALVAELFKMVTRHQPEQVDVGQPVPLPYGLKSVWVTEGMIHGATR